MFDVIKLLIVINTFVIILVNFITIRFLKYLLPLLLIAVPVTEFVLTETLNKEHFVLYSVIILTLLKTIRYSSENKYGFYDIAMLNSSVLLFSMIEYSGNETLNNALAISIMILSLGLIKSKIIQMWPLVLTILVSIFSVLLKYYNLTGNYVYITHYSLFIMGLMVSLIFLPNFFLKEEVKNNNSLYFYSYIMIGVLNLKLVIPEVDLALRSGYLGEDIIRKVLLITTIGSATYWLTRFFNNIDNLQLKLFSMLMVQMSIAFYLGIVPGGSVNISIVNFCFVTLVFYALIRESIAETEVKDHALFIIGMAGLVSFPPGISFIYKLDYLSFMMSNYSWYFIVVYLLMSILLISCIYYLVPDLQRSYKKNGVGLYKHELTLFAIIIYILPGYIL